MAADPLELTPLDPGAQIARIRSLTLELAQTPLSDSRLANLGARAILDGHADYAVSFGEVTRRALGRFGRRQWRALGEDAAERLELYGSAVERVVGEIDALLGDRRADRGVWAGMKAVYSGMIADRNDWELAETFFNSITRKVFDTVGVNAAIEFIDTDFETPPSRGHSLLWSTLVSGGALQDLLEHVLAELRLGLPLLRPRADAALIAERVEAHLQARGLPLRGLELQVLRAPFFRGQRAYVIGRIVYEAAVLPLVVALAHESAHGGAHGGARGDGGLVADAVLLDEDDVSILFSFTRSYFQVETERPYDLVRFLRTLMPRKRIAELYMSIGHPKHGKTELYRDLLAHLRDRPGRFDFAAGVPGMVMLAFTIDGLDLIFKLIRDRFPSAKGTDREMIRDKYHLVKTRDRAGRLVDAHEFEHLTFGADRFTPALLDELLREAGSTVHLDGDQLVFDQLYVERRVVPLNVYLRQASPAQIRAAIDDYGRSIKDLAATDFFPGDLLFKNFGVTRHGRVVFYDYDELVPLSRCNFRHVPTPRTDEEHYAAEPWYTVGPDDVFPEELRTFMGLAGYAREVFDELHGDLFTPELWWKLQERQRAGELVPILPYKEACRLPR